MIAHTMLLFSKINPLKYLLSMDEHTIRLKKWVMIISKLGIQYVEHKAIKG